MTNQDKVNTLTSFDPNEKTHTVWASHVPARTTGPKFRPHLELHHARYAAMSSFGSVYVLRDKHWELYEIWLGKKEVFRS